MISWTHDVAAFTATFLASLVEFVEALTIILAVGSVRGWRSALLGSVSAAVFLILIVAGLGESLSRVPLALVQTIVGLLALLFGMRWLRKAILRSAGIIKMHDEGAIFAKRTAALAHGAERREKSIDTVAFATAFQAVAIEGLEVVFIVLATGSVDHALPSAISGATLSCLVVISLGIVVHKPLTQVPENTLKFIVGILLSSYGAFWIGEGMQYHWPGGDISLGAIATGFVVVSMLAVASARKLSAEVGQS